MKMKGIWRLFSAPIEVEKRQMVDARMFWWLLVGLASSVSAFFTVAALLLPQYGSRFLGVVGCYDGLFLGLLVMSLRSRSGLAATLLLLASAFLVGFFSWDSGGVRSPGMLAFPIIVGVAGILQGARAAALMGVECIGISLALLVGELRGHLPPTFVHNTAISIWASLVILIAVFVLVHLVGSWRLRQVEEAWRDSDRRYHQLFEHAQVGIYRTTPDGKILEANPALLGMLGYESLEQLSACSLEEQGSYLPQYSRKKFREMVEKGEVRGLESEWRRADGQTVFVRENARAFRDGDGRVLCYDGTVEDFTEHKQLEIQRRQSSKMEAIGQLAGGVAHDFNNILGSFLLNVGRMQLQPNLAEVLKTSLKEMEVQTHRAAALTRRLLLFSRQEAIETKPLDLNRLLDELATMLRRILGENYDLIIDHESRALGVNADSSMIDQVVMNLCVNARDAMEEGGRIVVRAHGVALGEADVVGRPDARPGRFALLEVVDTGCGMSEATMKRLFELFFTTKDVGKGTGLGLATVLSVVQQHRGWVEVASTVGKGTRFSVYIPACDEVAANVSVGPSDPIRRGTECVLLVEDEPAIRLVLRLFLEQSGYHVLEAESGPAALRLWRENAGAVDLLLTDVVLPGPINGFDVAERLRSRKPALHVILCSGYNVERVDDRCDKLPGAIYLTKPFAAETLSAAIRECFENSIASPAV
jgi:two-component system cell cycle sensor histidine kinase/response regulator CckA